MIHLVTRTNRHLYELQLSRFFGSGDGPVDGYDDDHAAYLLALDPSGDVSVGVRLRPTVYGSVLADRFTRLIAPDRTLLDHPGTLEISRLVGSFEDREDRCRGELALAIVEAAQLLGAVRVVGAIHLAHWAALDGCGWRVRVLGTPMPGRNGTMVGFEVGVSPDEVGAMRESWAIERALVHLDDETAGGLPVELVGHQIGEAPPARSSMAPSSPERGALEETLLILDTIMNGQMLHRADNDLRQQGAITLLSIAQNRLRAQLARSEMLHLTVDVDVPAFRSTH